MSTPGKITLADGTIDADTPPPGYVSLYSKNGVFFAKNSSGSVTKLDTASSVSGSDSAPLVITSLLDPVMDSNEVWFIKGSAAVTPLVSDGLAIGKKLELFGCDNTDTVTFSNAGNPNMVLNGVCTLKAGSSLLLVWGGSKWFERSRNDA